MYRGTDIDVTLFGLVAFGEALLVRQPSLTVSQLHPSPPLSWLIVLIMLFLSVSCAYLRYHAQCEV